MRGGLRGEWLLLVASVAATVVVALGLVRVLAPRLLGQPVDLRVVQVDERVVPFFESVFRPEDLGSEEYILSDPLTSGRARPLSPVGRGIGPTDLLGFRNRGIPNRAGIVTIGDSQTYGTTVPLDAAWPQQLRNWLPDRAPAVYSMAVGGWGAVQYPDMFSKAGAFRPLVVVVAFYSGNDARESF